MNSNDVEKLNRRMEYYQLLVDKAVKISGLRGDNILDIGCGPGSSTKLLKNILPDHTIVGVDNNNHYINIAKSNYPFLDFVCADCYKMPFPRESVDSCFALNLLEVLKKPILALQEMRRITKRGGIICIVDIDYQNIIVAPEILHLKKLQRINCLIKRGEGYDPFVGRKLERYFIQAGISISFSGKIRIDNKISAGFEDTLLYNDIDKNFLIESKLFTKAEIEEMFDTYYSIKDQPNFVYAIEYDIVYGIVE